VEIWVSGVQKGTGETPGKTPILMPVISMPPPPVYWGKGANMSAVLS